MDETRELERLYYAMSDFIYVYLQKHQIDKTKMICNGLVCAIRDTTLEYMRGNMDLIIKKAIDTHEPNVRINEP